MSDWGVWKCPEGPIGFDVTCFDKLGEFTGQFDSCWSKLSGLKNVTDVKEVTCCNIGDGILLPLLLQSSRTTAVTRMTWCVHKVDSLKMIAKCVFHADQCTTHYNSTPTINSRKMMVLRVLFQERNCFSVPKFYLKNHNPTSQRLLTQRKPQGLRGGKTLYTRSFRHANLLQNSPYPPPPFLNSRGGAKTDAETETETTVVSLPCKSHTFVFLLCVGV